MHLFSMGALRTLNVTSLGRHSGYGGGVVMEREHLSRNEFVLSSFPLVLLNLLTLSRWCEEFA